MIRTNVYNVSVATSGYRTGDRFNAVCVDWPSLVDIRTMLEGEMQLLKKEAHSYEGVDYEFRVARIWARVEEFQRLINLMRVAVDPQPQSAPYTVDVKLAGVQIGAINVIPAPAWKKSA